jgi:hypothetical protein
MSVGERIAILLIDDLSESAFGKLGHASVPQMRRLHRGISFAMPAEYVEFVRQLIEAVNAHRFSVKRADCPGGIGGNLNFSQKTKLKKPHFRRSRADHRRPCSTRRDRCTARQRHEKNQRSSLCALRDSGRQQSTLS